MRRPTLSPDTHAVYRRRDFPNAGTGTPSEASPTSRAEPLAAVMAGRETPGGVEFVIVVTFHPIFGILASALYFQMRDKGRARNTVRALGLRVGLSIPQFLFLLISHRMGLIQASDVPVVVR